MRSQFQLILSLFIPLLLLLGCVSVTTPGAAETASQESIETVTLNVFAAASLADAFSEIGENFSAANPATEVVLNFAGSNQLATQIGQGASADVFASANATQM
ncbi:MAG: substrate-binding domain-containing protein, partial [Caldilineaceae bacterium]